MKCNNRFDTVNIMLETAGLKFYIIMCFQLHTETIVSKLQLCYLYLL